MKTTPLALRRPQPRRNPYAGTADSTNRDREAIGWPRHEDELEWAMKLFTRSRTLGFRVGWQLGQLLDGIQRFARRFR